MNKEDVLRYLEARSQLRRQQLEQTLAAIVLMLYIILRMLGLDGIYLDVAAGAMFFVFAINLDWLSWRYVTKNDLLDIIERQMAHDPAAMQILAKQQNDG